MKDIKVSEVSELLRQELKEMNETIQLEETGVVLTVGDGVARIYGLKNVRSGELLEFDNGARAIAMNLEEDNVGAVLFSQSDMVEENDTVKCTGKIASIIGRYYAMDRDKRWDRVKKAYDLIVNGEGEHFTNPVAAVKSSYEKDVTDEFIAPMVAVDGNGAPIGKLNENDAVIFFNFRNDRARELTHVLTQEDMLEQNMKKMNLYYCCLTPYDDKFKGLHILFDKDNVSNTLGEIVSKAGKSQLRIAETEKYAHVTFFFSGGREQVFENEKRVLINSPKVATYDLQPEMSALEVKESLLKEIKEGGHDLIVLNFANGDMVGHTGVYEAIRKAVKTVDECVAEIVPVAQEFGYTILITADHGNADNAVNSDGSPNTAHSLNPVPFIVVDKEIKEVKNGILADIAPTILNLMGIEKPEEMSGKSLVM